ncbi:hypothetical protein [Haladaptatus sp. CMAA 1911]|uniref:hypothetical protein n=1 Tax=unclassified Haladaptatus TaxID=2622732 RepID=UPI003754A3EA
MAPEPSIYLLDEPSAGLSPALVEDLFDIVRTVVDDGAQVILIEQSIRSALRIADYVHILANGRAQFEWVRPTSRRRTNSLPRLLASLVRSSTLELPTYFIPQT